MATGHIENRDHGKWLLVVEHGRDSGSGERNRESKIFKGSKRNAKKELAAWLAAINAETYTRPTGLTLENYLKQWLSNHSLTISPHTKKNYQNAINSRIIPLLGRIALEDIKPLHLRNFYRKIIEQGRLDGARKGEPVGQGTLDITHRTLHKALNDAVEDELILKNPASIVRPPRMAQNIIDDDEEIDTKVQVFNEEQVATMLSAAKETKYYPLLFVAVRTGMRRSELLGLRWKDVDLKERVITVRQVLGYSGGGFFYKPPKTAKSRRVIGIDDDVVAVLKEHKKRHAENRLFFGEEYEKRGSNGLVFCHKNGKPIHPSTVTRWFPQFLVRNGLPRLTLHSLRHTHASLLLKAGVDIKVISERLGHSSIQITYDVYSHLYPDAQEEAVLVLQKMLNTQSG